MLPLHTHTHRAAPPGCSPPSLPLAPALLPRAQPIKIHKKAGGDAKRMGGAAAKSGEFEDEELECRDCQAKFVFTVGEQEFFAQKGFDNKPVRGVGGALCARISGLGGCDARAFAPSVLCARGHLTAPRGCARVKTPNYS
jgi:hypothetical protein